MELNDNNMKRIRGLVLFTTAVVVIGVNYRQVVQLAARILAISFPFLLGAAIAFVLNVPMRKLEKLLPVSDENKMKRPLCLTLTVIFVFGLVILVTFVVGPQLIDTLTSLQKSIPDFLMEVQRKAEAAFAQNPSAVNWISSIQIDWKSMIEGFLAFLTSGAGTVLTSTLSAAVSIVSGFTTFGIAFIFAVYILLQKEVLQRQSTKLLLAFFPDQISNQVVRIAGLTERTFSNFLTGQCVEAVILGLMFFVTLTVLKLPYALLVGVLIAFTALIPIFGAFIGCAIGVFLMLMVNPVQALVFTCVFFVLQQLEGNLIYPHVVGNSVGLPSIWVLVAVTIGGSAMGIVGMLIFIPLCSVLYSLLRDVVNEKMTVRQEREQTRRRREEPDGSLEDEV